MCKKGPLVSIVIPVYNRRNIIRETLDCAINQTYKNIEIVISDNGSTDGTWEILREYQSNDSRIKLLRNQLNVGPVLNWKVCLDHVTGGYTKILWSDDLITLDFIEKLLEKFDDETAFVLSGVSIFGCGLDDIKASSKYHRNQCYLISEYLEDVLIYGKLGFPVSPGGAIFRTKDILNSYVEEVPNLDGLEFKRFGAGNDLLFFLLSTKGYSKVKCVPEVLAYFKYHDASISVYNQLDLYYEYSRLFFIMKHSSGHLSIWKAKLFFKLLKDRNYRNLYKMIDEDVKIYYLIKYLIKRVSFYWSFQKA